MRLRFTLLALLINIAFAHAQEPTADVDICVYGSTPAGIMAAYTAKMKGKSVLLVSPTKRIGGLTAGGLGWTDIGDSASHRRIIKGFAREFYHRVSNHYGLASTQFYLEPKVALATFQGFLREAGLKDDKDVWYQWRIVSAHKEGNDLQTITLEDGTNPSETPHRTVRARIFMDCSYEGDLMARAGVSYTIGREPASQYGEPENGVQMLSKHQFCDGVDPYVVKGDPKSGLLWGIMPEEMGKKGEGDNHIQAYNYRITLSKENFRPITAEKPDNYDPSKYELLFRWMEKKGWSGTGDCIKWTYMKNSSGPNSWNAMKTDNNNNGAFSTDMIGYSWDYPEATYEQRDSIAKLHEDYTKGLLYILWTDPRVPASIQSEYRKWGYPLDEYEDNNNFTPVLYIREARRMLGRMVMTEDYCLRTKSVDDPIAWGAYTMDSHNCGRYVVNGMVKNEGDVQRHLTAGPYGISYRAVTPKEAEARNLIVPVCLSASHIAYGSIRMEPVYMVLGETTALAAIQAIDEHDGCVQQVDASRCIHELENGLILADNEDPVEETATLTIDITDRVLQNPSFEAQYTSGKVPQGWSEMPSGTTLQRGIDTNCPNLDGKQAYICKPATGTTINEPLKLYQQIPAAKLGAGTYRVSCLMWVEKDYYGTACLFADNAEGTNCNVQYWCNEPYYKNATSGYDNLTYTDRSRSFASHAGGLNNAKTRHLQRMEVYITLREGDDLLVGIRTNSANQDADKAGAGYFYVDNFHIEKVARRELSADAFSQKNLVNYRFEQAPDGSFYPTDVKTTKNEAPQGIYGWQSNAWTDQYGAVSDGTNLEQKWAGWVASSTVIPNDFRLYQTIPADSLTPGIYEVNARMWQYQTKLGITRLYGQTPTHASVMYYGSQDRYTADLLTDGEEATFASLNANTANGRVSEMSLQVAVGQDEPLEVGVKSGYGAEANKTNGQNHGKFYVDFLRVSKVSDLPVTYDAAAVHNDVLAQPYTQKVILQRSFAAGQWTGLCLPFSLGEADIRALFGDSTRVMQYDGMQQGRMLFSQTNSIEAGTPYLICPTDPLPSPITLQHVMVEADAPKNVTYGDYTLQGTFCAVSLQSPSLLIQGDATLSQGKTAEGFSAYVQAPEGTILAIDGETAIGPTPTLPFREGDAHVYDLQGRPATTHQSGIVVSSAGKVYYGR